MPNRIGLFAGLLLAVATLWGVAAAAEPPPIETLFGGSFALTDQDGQVRSDADFHGHYLLIYFGYTNCPLICPTNLTTMAAALDRLGPLAARIQPLFITIDPARDTPELLKAYVANFHVRLIGLTGSEAAIADVAGKYRVHRRQILMESEDGHVAAHHVTEGQDSVPSNQDYLADHGTLTYLMGPGGDFLTLFPHNTPPHRMAEVIGTYLEDVRE